MIVKKKGILIVAVASALCLAVCISIFALSTQTAVYPGSTSITLFDSGKCCATIEVDGSKLAPGLEDKDAFLTYFQIYLNSINNHSGDNDYLTVEQCHKTEKGYSVTVSTRRVDKLEGIGEIAFSAGDKMQPEIQEELKNFIKGIVKTRVLRVYPGEDAKENLYFIGYSDYSKNQNVNLQPVDFHSGETVDTDAFMSALTAGDKQLLIYKLPDMSFIEKISLTLPGDIQYIPAQGVTVVNERTLEITPVTLNANIKDRNGSETTLDTMIGYIVYQKNLSPVALGAILIGGIWLVALVVFLMLRYRETGNFVDRKLTAQVRKYKMLYFMLIPGLAILLIFHYVPYFGLTAAFQDYDLLEGISSEWVGMKYFINIFFARTDRIYRVMRNTIFISLLRVVTNFPIILFYALFVYSLRNRKLKSVVQTVSFIPYFLSWTACAGFLYAIISDYGILNSILGVFGIEPVSWYGEVDAWWGILSISSLWKGMGWGTLIYIAAMCNIDNELYEASALDGCGPLRQMFTVTIPGIMPVICLQLILDIASLLKDNYEQILALVNGATGLKETTEVIGQISYDALKNGSNFGSAVAFGLIQGTIGLILVFVSNGIVRKTDNEGIL